MELETVITTRKQRNLRKTGSVKGNSTDTSHTLSSSCFVAGNGGLTLNKEGIEEGIAIVERYNGSPEITGNTQSCGVERVNKGTKKKRNDLPPSPPLVIPSILRDFISKTTTYKSCLTL